jgi:hypothetical protein
MKATEANARSKNTASWIGRERLSRALKTAQGILRTSMDKCTMKKVY